MTTHIISRHDGAVEWIRSKGFDGAVTEQFDEKVIAGDVYIGTLPIPLIYSILKGAQSLSF